MVTINRTYQKVGIVELLKTIRNIESCTLSTFSISFKLQKNDWKLFNNESILLEFFTIECQIFLDDQFSIFFTTSDQFYPFCKKKDKILIFLNSKYHIFGPQCLITNLHVERNNSKIMKISSFEVAERLYKRFCDELPISSYENSFENFWTLKIDNESFCEQEQFF